MRGRLIQRFVCVINRLDPTATAAVVGGGYDPEFRVPRTVRDGSQMGTGSRRELSALRLPCQLDRAAWGRDRMAPTGHDAEYDLSITLHQEDLETNGLIDPTDGRPMLATGDRIHAIEQGDGIVVETFANPPGLFVVDTERAGYGLLCFGTPRFNLFYLHCRFAAKVEPR